MMSFLKIILSQCLFLILLPATLVMGQFYNGSTLTFGKSRVQYRDFVWSFYQFKRHDVYFYTGGKDLALFTANSADQIMNETEEFFDFPIEGKLQFIVFNKLSDLQQSNIGFVSQEDANIGGSTRIIGSKIFLYFNGDHNHLETQIRSGINEVLISQLLYGGNWKDRVKNSTLLTLPEWYMEGLVSYCATGWNTEISNRVKDGILSGRYKKFNRLSGMDAACAGNSIWNFIANRYGESLIPSILYMTKVSRNIESGMLFVLGTSLKKLSEDWLEYYHNKYYGAEKYRSLPETNLLKRTRNNRIFRELQISPDSKYTAFATNDLGKNKVWIYDIEKERFNKIIRIGYKTDELKDYGYPLLAWHPNSEMLSVITEKKDQLWLTYYFLKTKKKETRPLHHFHQILDFSYSSDGKKFVFSAIKDGQTDIFVYHIAKNTFENLTNDLYDDHTPLFINNDQDIVFSSNRTSDTLVALHKGNDGFPLKMARKNDLFIFDYSKKNKVLNRVTRSLDINETQPIELGENHLLYLSDANGVKNQFIVEMDSVLSHVDTIAHYRFNPISKAITNYSRNIVEQNINPGGNKMGEIIFSKGRYKMYLHDISMDELKSKGEALENNSLFNSSEDSSEDGDPAPSVEATDDKIQQGNSNVLEEKQPTDYIDIGNYLFEKEKNSYLPTKTDSADKSNGETIHQQPADTADTKKVKPVENLRNALVRSIDRFLIPERQWNYNTAFASDYFISQLDNRYLSGSYQKFTGGGAIYTNPGLNLFFKVGVSDLLEDHRVVGGVRLSSNLSSNEFFISYENLKKRLDKQVVLHRQSMVTFLSNGVGIKVQTHDAKLALKWPFSNILFVKGAASLRNDRNVTLSTDVMSLQEPNTFDYWGGFTGELVFDNTIKKGLNLYNGTRGKMFGEWHKQIDKAETNLYVVGLDIRNYLKIHRDIIWANRLATSTSFGDYKLVYYMGSVDGWLKPVFNNDIEIATDQNYAYQTLATNMRGFNQNIRNGNSFAVINSELRIPLFKYLTNKPMKSDFLRNFQIVPFTDIGTAWTGKNPYTEDNSFNTGTIDNGPITVRLIHQREPIVAGYGIGLRSRLFGYFVRVDWARGIEDGITQDRMFYWSLNLDF